MTSPGVMAMSSPTRKPSGAGVGSSAKARKPSSSQLAVPRARFAPASSMVRAMTTGLSHGTFEGENTSSHWRAMKSTRAAFFGVMPRTSRVAARHQSSCARNNCSQNR
jgi:hypothetical protein